MTIIRPVPADVCLQCGQTRAQVRADDAPCATEEGYEYREVRDEWPQHHWRDWSDKMLAAHRIKPGFFDVHRRDDIYALPYAPCEHTTDGHLPSASDEWWDDEHRDDPRYLMRRKGECIRCGASPEAVEAAAPRMRNTPEEPAEDQEDR